MICDNCGTKNDEARSFCLQCGNPLGWICPCSFPNKKDDLFCGGCGRPFIEGNYSPGSGQADIDLALNQLKEKEIKNLIEESLMFGIGQVEEIEQEDIDEIFK